MTNSRFSLRPFRLLLGAYSLLVKLPYIAAIIDLLHVVQVPERKRIEFLDLRISLHAEGENILDGLDGWVRHLFQRCGVVFVKTIPLLVVAHREQLRAVLFDNRKCIRLLGLEKMNASISAFTNDRHSSSCWLTYVV